MAGIQRRLRCQAYPRCCNIIHLCISDGSTGKYAVYRKWEHLEIIFEVAPYITACRRKAIIGNTITTIVFQQSGCFDPSAIVSQVLHSFCVVQPVNVNGAVKYRIGTAMKKGVPRFRPSIPCPAIFDADSSFIDFLFHKRMLPALFHETNAL